MFPAAGDHLLIDCCARLPPDCASMPHDSDGMILDQDDEPDDLVAEQVASNEKKNTRLTTEQQLIRAQHLKQETVKVIESLLDGKTDAQYLRKCVSLLSKSDYEDLNTERSLAKVCGYPLCDNMLNDVSNKSQQKFKIDYKKRKIFRMDQRILFCSVQCLESSAFLKDQLPDEALWLRYNDNEGYEGLYRVGAGIRFADQSEGGEQDQPVTKHLKPNFSSRESVSFPYIKQDHIKELQKSINSLTIKDRDVSSSSSATRDSRGDHQKEESGTHVNRSRDDADPVTGSWIRSADSQVHPVAAHHVVAAGDEKPDARERVTRVLKEWITEQTLQYILGDDFSEQYIRMKDQQLKESLAQEDGRKRKLEESIENIIQRLDRQDFLEDLLIHPQEIQADPVEKFVLAANGISQQHEQAGRKSGFKSRRKNNTGSRKKVSFKDVEDPASDPVSGTSRKTENPEPKLPVTSNSPDAVRRKIVLDQLHQSLINNFPLHLAGIMFRRMQPLFHHVNLTASTAILKKEEWTLVTLFLIRFLEVRSRLAKTRAFVSGTGVESATEDHEELLSILNDEAVCRLAKSFYDRPEDWHQKVHLFLYQTEDVDKEPSVYPPA